MRVRIGHEIGYTRRTSGIEGLLQTRGIEASTNGIRADDCDWFSLIPGCGNETRSLARSVDLSWYCFAHLVLVATMQLKLLEAGERVFRLALPEFILAQTVSIPEPRADFESAPKRAVPSEPEGHPAASGRPRAADGHPYAS